MQDNNQDTDAARANQDGNDLPENDNIDFFENEVTGDVQTSGVDDDQHDQDENRQDENRQDDNKNGEPADPAVNADDKTSKTTTPIDSEELVKTIVKSIQESNNQTGGQQPPKELSEVEKRKLLNVWEPTEQDANDLLEGGETALAAFQRIRDGLVKQAHTMAYVQQKQMVDALRAELTPHIEYAQQQRLANEEKQFFEQNPDLGNHKELVTAVFNNYKAQGRQFKSFDEAANTLAGDVRSLLKNAGVELKPEQQQGKHPDSSGQQQQSKITPQPRGGQRGTSGQQQQQPNTPEEPSGAEVF